MATVWRVSHHACERWVERVGDVNDTWRARSRIQRSVAHSVVIPNRLATDLWVPKVRDEATAIMRRAGVRYRFSGSVVFVTQGKRVITLLLPTTEDIATLLVWQLTGQWLPTDELVEEEIQPGDSNPKAAA